VTDVKLTAAVPVFVTVPVRGALVVPNAVEKLSASLDTLNAGWMSSDTPAPVAAATSSLPFPLKSATTNPPGPLLTPGVAALVKVPCPLPNGVATVLSEIGYCQIQVAVSVEVAGGDG
jgi:hypothetical protein